MYEMPTSKSYQRCLQEVQETAEFKSAFNAKAGDVTSLNDHSQAALNTTLLRNEYAQLRKQMFKKGSCKACKGSSAKDWCVLHSFGSQCWGEYVQLVEH